MKSTTLFYNFILIVVIGFFLLACENSTSVDRENLNQYGKLAIGVYLGRTVEEMKTASVVYEYEVNNQSFQNSDNECYLDSDKAKKHFYFTEYPLLKGNEFVVLYDSIYPKTSIIRLDYPLRDSTDFKSYVQEFMKRRSEMESF